MVPEDPSKLLGSDASPDTHSSPELGEVHFRDAKKEAGTVASKSLCMQSAVALLQPEFVDASKIYVLEQEQSF